MNKNNEVKYNTSDNGPITKETFEAYNDSKKIDLGWFGKCFGSAEHAPTSICGILIIFLLIVSSLLILFNQQIAMEYTKSVVLPLITLALGYLFGKNR